VSVIQPTDAGIQALVALAEERNCTVGELIAAHVRDTGAAPSQLPLIVGIFADESDLMDEVMADVYRTRETQSLRGIGEGHGQGAD
jgi:hypothetical protein